MSWMEIAADLLASAQNQDGGWPYAVGQASAIEPTALAGLALGRLGAGREAIEAAGGWLLARRLDSGLLTASANHSEPSWLTPLAGLLLAESGYDAQATAVAGAVLLTPVLTFPNLLPGLYGYDTQVGGWPWTPGDYGFTEPTCLAVILLKRLGYASSPRVREAVRFLRDRALAGGGWNYGEPRVLGADLFPTVLPTALALLALADEPDPTTAAGLAWLKNQGGRIHSLISLGWAGIALSVLGELDAAWTSDMLRRWSELEGERQGVMESALLLLALAGGQDHPLGVL